jgi:hypothetical protein
MRWLIFAVAASALSACTHQNAPDEALLEKQRLEAQSNAVFASVEEHAGCAGFHHAYAELESEEKSRVAFYKTSARNAEIAATEIAASQVPKDLAVEMVNQLAETHAAEWAYVIDSKTGPEIVLAQAEKCQVLAEKQKTVVRDIVKEKYGFKKQ